VTPRHRIPTTASAQGDPSPRPPDGEPSPRHPSDRRKFAAAAAILLVVAIALWAPFDGSTTPNGDGWILKNRAAAGAVLFAGEPTRALLALPWAIAQLLAPDSFVGIHLLFIAIVWLKGVALFTIIRRLPGGDDDIALLGGGLLMVYPASTWSMAIDGPLDRHWAVLFLLAAICFLLLGMRRRARGWFAAMGAAQILSLWTNEAILPVALTVPVLIWWIGRDDRRSVLGHAGLWLALPICNAVHNLVHHLTCALAPHIASRLSHGVAILALDDGWRPMAASLALAYRRHFADCWIRSVQSFPSDWSLRATALIAATAVTAVALLLAPRTPKPGRRLRRFLIVAGLVLVGCGFAAFVPTNLRFTDGRSFIISSLGAAVALTGAASWLASIGPRFRVIGTVLLGTLIGIGAAQLLEQHAAYARGSRSQDAMLAAIVEQAPTVRPRTVFAVAFNETPGQAHRRTGFWPRDNVVENAIQFLYDDDSLRARLVFRGPNSAFSLTEEGVSRRPRPGTPPWLADYSRVLVYRDRPGRPTTLLPRLPDRLRSPDADDYHPERIITPDGGLPPRIILARHE
jgi:hypothetical protein